MHITPYLSFNGNCREAVAFYADLLGGEVDFLQTFGETPAAEHVGPESKDRVMHAHVTYPGGALMASDGPPEMYKPPQGTWISLHVETPEEADRFWGRLAEGGAVMMPLEPTFWAKKFGMVTDRFGTPWMVNCA